MGSVRRWNFAGPDTTSTSCSALRYSSVRSSFGKRADDVEQQAAGDDGLAGGRVGGLERHAHAELHVGGLELGRAVLHAEEDAGERGNGTAGGRAAHGDAEASEERFTGNGELQKMLPISDRGDWRVFRS